MRITDSQLARIQELILHREKGESLSDLVRQAIDQFLTNAPEASFDLPTDCSIMLKRLSEESARPSKGTIAECIRGIYGLLQTGVSPLLVEEIKMRRDYSQRQKRTVAESFTQS